MVIRGGREAPSQPSGRREVRRAISRQRLTEVERTTRLATELQGIIVARARHWRLRPADTLCAVGMALGTLAAKAVRGDHDRVGPLVEELHRQVLHAAEGAFRPRETP